MLSFTRSIVSLSTLVLVACSSSNFDVASSGNDGGGDTSSIDDSSGLDTTPGDDTSSDVIPTPDSPFVDGIGSDGTADGSTCPAGTACPSGAAGGVSCVDLATDPKNCGTCTKAVCHGELCSGGAPKCVPGFGACPASAGCLGCKDFVSDPLNCGACGKACVVGELCIAGTCTVATTCPGDAAKCTGGSTVSAGCVDTNNDRNNCGGCGAICAPSEYCAKGACVGYTSAPGCTTCPCATCGGKFGNCCKYAGEVVCANGDCPGG